MFHTYILTSARNTYTGLPNKVDFDRASFLMDRDLLKQALSALEHHLGSGKWDVDTRADFVWRTYCDLHLDKYDEDFGPDVKDN